MEKKLTKWDYVEAAGLLTVYTTGWLYALIAMEQGDPVTGILLFNAYVLLATSRINTALWSGIAHMADVRADLANARADTASDRANRASARADVACKRADRACERADLVQRAYEGRATGDREEN